MSLKYVSLILLLILIHISYPVACFTCPVEIEEHLDFRLFSPPDCSWYTAPYKTAVTYMEECEPYEQHFGPRKPKTVFFFPDWGEDPQIANASVFKLAHAFYDHQTNKYVEDLNTVLVDYHKVTKSKNEMDYSQAFEFTPRIGKCIGAFLKEFIRIICPERHVHLIGVGMGAQIMAYAAKTYGRGLLRLTGLDPAYKLYKFPTDHLNEGDGRFVDVIHTDAGFGGYLSSVGHADFYPNNGVRPQPACIDSSLNVEDCSHQKAWHYYLESITNKHAFTAVQCSSRSVCIVKGERSTCTCSKFTSNTAHMGYGVETTASGDYYLKTGSKYPYSIIGGHMEPRSGKASKLYIRPITCTIITSIFMFSVY